MSEAFKALRDAESQRRGMDFRCNDNPKCPHCGETYSIEAHEAYQLLSEDSHDVTCGECDRDFQVSTNVSYSFNTDEQEDRDDEDETPL